MSRARERDGRSEDGAFWGVLLIALGLFFLLVRMERLHEWWPLMVVGVGVVRLATARSPKSVGSGTTLALMGVWFLIASNQWRGLEWHTSWPLSLVAIGVGSLARALAETLWRRKGGDHALT